MFTVVVAMPECGASVLRQPVSGNFGVGQLVAWEGAVSDCLAMASASRTRGEVGVANQG